MSRNGNEIDHKNAGTLENHSEENREDRVLCEILMGVEEHRDSFRQFHSMGFLIRDFSYFENFKFLASSLLTNPKTFSKI